MIRFNDRSQVGAFTLIEMIIAITVFTIFIGFVMSTYLSFHRAQQEAALTRSLLLESEATFGLLVDSLKSQMIDYDRYAGEDSSSSDAQFRIAEKFYFGVLDSSDTLITDTLYLIDADGVQTAYVWDEDEETLSLQTENEDGGLDIDLLHSEGINASFVSFEIFPDVDPYDSENTSDDDLQFQPIVQLVMAFSMPGRVRDEVTVDLQTSVTSRFYQ